MSKGLLHEARVAHERELSGAPLTERVAVYWPLNGDEGDISFHGPFHGEPDGAVQGYDDSVSDDMALAHMLGVR